MTTKNKAVKWLLGLAGAAAGGVVGYYIFVWLVQQRLYGLALPGAALGAGGTLLFRDRSPVFGVVCAALAIPLSLFAEWKKFPFIDDDSFGYFLTHLQDLKPITLIMIVVGALCAFWIGQGISKLRPETRKDQNQ